MAVPYKIKEVGALPDGRYDMRPSGVITGKCHKNKAFSLIAGENEMYSTI